MNRIEVYDQYAQDCIDLSRRHPDAGTRAILRGIAGAWVRLGDQVATREPNPASRRLAVGSDAL